MLGLPDPASLRADFLTELFRHPARKVTPQGPLCWARWVVKEQSNTPVHRSVRSPGIRATRTLRSVPVVLMAIYSHHSPWPRPPLGKSIGRGARQERLNLLAALVNKTLIFQKNVLLAVFVQFCGRPGSTGGQMIGRVY
jgi:hypothetical protein